LNKKPLALAVILILITSLTVYPAQNADAAKTVTVTQKCENAALELFIVNQEGKPAKNAKIFDHARMEVLASADENGFVVLPADLQGKPLRAGGGSYTLTSFIAENCQPSEIEFEKSD